MWHLKRKQFLLLVKLHIKYMHKRYKHLVVGGTFDLLHRGHEYLLGFAFHHGEKVTIGITSQKMVLKFKNRKPYLSFDQRLADLENYLKIKEYSNFKIVEIEDIYGVAVSDKSIDGIVVTKDTMPGAKKINTKRKELGLPPLKVLIAPTKLAHDKEKISSNRIRQGEINRKGQVYSRYIKKKDLLLPQELRPILAKPFGKIVKDHSTLKRLLSTHQSLVISVGDEVAKTLFKINIEINIKMVDFKINRKEQTKDLEILGIKKDETIVTVENPAGTIKSQLSAAIYKAIREKRSGTTIIVIGEEDLAVIPCVLFSPLETMIVYGQREEGAVVITVDEQLKEKVLDLVRRFKISQTEI